MQMSLTIRDEVVAAIDAQGRPRQEFIRAAIDYYLVHLASGAELSSRSRIDLFQLLDAEGNVTHQGHVTRVTGP